MESKPSHSPLFYPKPWDIGIVVMRLNRICHSCHSPSGTRLFEKGKNLTQHVYAESFMLEVLRLQKPDGLTRTSGQHSFCLCAISQPNRGQNKLEIDVDATLLFALWCACETTPTTLHIQTRTEKTDKSGVTLIENSLCCKRHAHCELLCNKQLWV